MEKVQLVFQLTQHSRDQELMKSLIEYFNCGQIYKRLKAFDYKVTKLSDLTTKKLFLLGEKSYSF